MSERHPDLEALGAYHDGELDPAGAELVGAHVLACGDCRRVIERLDAIDEAVLERVGLAAEERARSVPWPASRARWKPTFHLAAAAALAAAIAWWPSGDSAGPGFEADPGAVVRASGRRLELERGRIVCRVEPERGPRVVHTPAAEVRALGAEFVVEVRGEEDSMARHGAKFAGSAVLAVVTVAVVEGRVRVSNPAGEAQVEAGEVVEARVLAPGPTLPGQEAPEPGPAPAARHPLGPSALAAEVLELEARHRALAGETYRLHREFHERISDQRYRHVVRVVEEMERLVALLDALPEDARSILLVPGGPQLLGEVARFDAEAIEFLFFEFENRASPRRRAALTLAETALPVMGGVSPEERKTWRTRLLALGLADDEDLEVRLGALRAAAQEGLESEEARNVLPLVDPEQPGELRSAALTTLLASAPAGDPSIRDRLVDLASAEKDPDFARELAQAAATYTWYLEGEERARELLEDLTK